MSRRVFADGADAIEFFSLTPDYRHALRNSATFSRAFAAYAIFCIITIDAADAIIA